MDIEWRAMSRGELDRAFDNAGSVPESTAVTSGWAIRSRRIRAARPAHLDLRYGPRAKNRIDYLHAQTGADVLVFLHGGYWHTRSKEDFTFVAEGALSRNINVALVGYTLAPNATLDEMADEVHSAIDYLIAKLPGHGTDSRRVLVAGWSAGGQLAAMMLDHPNVKGVLAISGIFDLEPVRHSSLNSVLGLDPQQARRNSPIARLGVGHKPIAVVVGGKELPMLRSQTAAYAHHRIEQRLPVIYEELPLADHFTILDELANADGRLLFLSMQMIQGTREC